jgi:hypothetical protein
MTLSLMRLGPDRASFPRESLEEGTLRIDESSEALARPGRPARPPEAPAREIVKKIAERESDAGFEGGFCSTSSARAEEPT